LKELTKAVETFDIHLLDLQQTINQEHEVKCLSKQNQGHYFELASHCKCRGMYLLPFTEKEKYH